MAIHDVMAYLCLMLLRSLCAFLLGSLSANLIASDSLPEFDKIDRHVDSLRYDGEDLETLVLMLTIPFDSESEKLRAIYKYVIDHITYDAAAYKNGHRRINQNNRDILRRKKAVCWGYAQLISELCHNADITCFTITGYAKDSPVPPRSFEKANHAWNAVYLEGVWFLLDATWGSVLQSGENYFSREYGLNYFLSDPAIFGLSHHPLMPMWQMLPCPISYQSFVTGQMHNEPSNCGFNFQDSIAQFSELSYLDQQLKIMQVAFALNKTNTNRSQVGHALVDIAIDKKEYGDQLMELDSLALAMEELEASLRLFTLAKSTCTFYPWQEEAHVFSAINLAQVSYGVFVDDTEQIPLIVNRFKRAKKLIEESRLKESVINQAEKLVDDYLGVLEAN